MPQPPELSVIVPTRDRPQSLARVLAALTRQSLAADRFEVLVVDDGSAIEVVPQAPADGWPFRLQVLRQPHRGLAAARNHGAEAAAGGILCFLDDDVEPTAEWLVEHRRAHSTLKGRVATVGALPFGDRTPRDCFTWFLDRRGHYDLYVRPHKYPGGAPPLPPLNGNSSVRREDFFEVGGYDTELGPYGGEDLEIGYRLRRAGVTFHYCPTAIGYHQHGKGFPEFCRDLEASGQAMARVLDKHPELESGQQFALLSESFRELPARRWLAKSLVLLSLRLGPVEAAARAFALRGQRSYGLRRLLYPIYRWVGGCSYARGLRRGLTENRIGAPTDRARRASSEAAAGGG